MGDCQKRRFGCLYQDGVCAAPDEPFRQSAKIELRDGPSDIDPITWVEAMGVLVSRRVYFLGVTWEELRQQGFIYGTKVTLNGRDYLCRSLRLRPARGDQPNEWRLFMEATEKDITWGIYARGFHGQEFIWGDGVYKSDRCMVAGLISHDPGLVCAHDVDKSTLTVGLRPILEPIGPEPVLDKSLISRQASVFCGSDRVDGTLVDFSDYDLVIQGQPGQELPPIIHPGISEEDNLFVIDRQAVQHMKLL